VRILIVTATSMEIAPLIENIRYTSDGGLGVKAYTRAGHDVDVLITGVGMVATAAWCSHALARKRYDLVLNLGVCGSFDRALEPDTVVHVIADRIAELGAEDDETFLTIQALNLLGDNEFPFTCGQLMNPAPPAIVALTGLPAVTGITVNTVHGNDRSIAAVAQRFKPQVESMEGAAFMYACLIHEVVFAQVRAVSNLVEKRNRAAWKMAEAIRSLGLTALSILDHA
jgi:futalosine hydrolase